MDKLQWFNDGADDISELIDLKLFKSISSEPLVNT
jgi:hypothetical protein